MDRYELQEAVFEYLGESYDQKIQSRVKRLERDLGQSVKYVLTYKRDEKPRRLRNFVLQLKSRVQEFEDWAENVIDDICVDSAGGADGC